MKKTHKGISIKSITINKLTSFIEVKSTDDEVIKTTREQRAVILKNYKNKQSLKEALIKAFNNPKIIGDDLNIVIE